MAKIAFPLGAGSDGWYPGDNRCLVCGASLVAPPERIRVFIGTSAEPTSGAGHGVHFDAHWYGPQAPGRSDTGLRTVRVFEGGGEGEKVLEFCSTRCLRSFFGAIADGLE